MFSAEDLRRRLQHFINETVRAPRAAVAFANADRQALGDLAAESQRDAHELLGNQIPETITLADAGARDRRVRREQFRRRIRRQRVGRSCRPPTRSGSATRWVRAYAQRMPHVGTVAWFAARPGPAATEIAL